MITNSNERKIGLEYEFLGIQMKDGQAVTRDIMKAIWKDFAEAPNVELITDPGTKQPVGVVYTQDDGQEVVINTDAGICIIEFGFLPYKTLKECEENLQKILKVFLPVAEKHGATLLAYGLQPKTPCFYPDLKSEKIWYRGYVRFPEFADGHHLFHNIAANQPCVDVTYDELIPVVNVLNAIGGITIVLFANSGWGEWKGQDQHEVREHRWDFWMKNPVEHQKLSGIPLRPFKDFHDYVAYNWDIRLPAVHRGKAIHVIDPAPSITDYMHGNKWSSFNVADSHPSEVTPSMEDADVSNMYIWIQARPKYFFKPGTDFKTFLAAYDEGGEAFDQFARKSLNKLYVEVRNIACQPRDHLLTAPAFILGIIENLKEAESLVQSKPWEFWRALRVAAIEKSLEADGLAEPAKQFVEIAERGLKKRGLGEEKYLQVLYERIEKKESPALSAIRLAEKEGVEALIESTKIS